MKQKLMILLCVLASISVSAQDVNKAVVQSQADAAAAAGKELKTTDNQDKIWKFSGTTGLNAAATGMVNWAAGGNNSVNGVVYARLRLLYSKDKWAWDTNLDTEFGLAYIDQATDNLQKSNDKFNIASKVGYEFAKHWYATALAGFRTQFAMGRSYEGKGDMNPILSRFMAPAYTDISVGIDWQPNKIFSLYISPIAGRLTTVSISNAMNREYDYLYPIENGGLEQELKEKYSVWKYDDNNNKDYSSNTRAELGFSLKGSVNYAIKDFKIQSSLLLYTPYSWDKTRIPNENGGMSYRDNNRRVGNFDVDWDVALSYQFLKCLQVTFSTSLKYYNGAMIEKDGIATERVQFKSILGLGVGYSF